MILKRIDDEKQKCLEAISNNKSHTSINDTRAFHTQEDPEIDSMTLMDGINDVQQKLRDIKTSNMMDEQQIYEM